MSGKPARRSGVRVYRKGDAGDVPLYWQIHAQLRESIVNGSRRPGDLLPASRTLAKELKVARNTVEAAIAVLVTEGLVERRVGSGTRVAVQPPERVIGG
jgi:DNA-binding GntR family transcriptional regulator